MPLSPVTCLFLHSSTDKQLVSEIVRLAERDPPEPGMQTWFDDRDINNDSDIDPDISEKIRTSRVIVFCVGKAGLGPYQASHPLRV
jgi:hypothetical protein